MFSNLFNFSFILLLFSHAVALPFMTKEECAHTGMQYRDPDVVQEFINSKFSKLQEARINDLDAHHRVSQKFCEARRKNAKKKRCSWQDYYLILDNLREPYKNLYDPGMPSPVHLSKIQDAAKSGSKHQSGCEVLVNPTAKKLYPYVAGNKPVIIKGVADKWPALKKWTDEYLLRTLWGKQVVVSVTPTGDFDGPEPKDLWDSSLPETFVIARPAHWNTAFETFMLHLDSSNSRNLRNGSDAGETSSPNDTISRKKGLLTTRSGVTVNVTSVGDASFYLEYFPLAVLGEKLIADIPAMPWSNFLIKRTNLLWMGGGSRTTVGRLHFDRNENLMAMIRGTKTFILYDPGQSGNLYGDLPLRSASLNVSFEGDDRVLFRRDKRSIGSSVDVHVYSPVDVLRPNYTEHPLLRNAKGFECTISAGDILFVPSHWWHQVISYDDDRGKSIGVNTFYEPFFHRPGYKCVPPYMLYNRHYNHLRELGTAGLCSKKHICFKGASSSSSSSSSTAAAGGKRRKSKKSRKSKGRRSKARGARARSRDESSSQREL